VEQGIYFLTMEFVEGVSVAELLEGESEKAPLTPEEGAYLGVEICRALDYAHRRMKIVHRDITPRNVMVDDEGQVKLIDFGIAARARAGERIFGSPGHMPPEQMAGDTLAPATDLFAVAVLLMETWTARAPFRRPTVAECEEAMAAAHPRPGDFNPRLIPLDDVIGRTMALAPEKRPQDAEELSRALRKYLQDVDLGDVARSLGARAKAARLRADRKREPDSERAAVPEEATRPLTETKTFAAREEAQRWSERAPPPDKIETVATRPIETPVEEPRRAPRPASRFWLGAAGLAIAAGAWFVAGRHAVPRETPPPVTAALSASASAAPAPEPPPPAPIPALPQPKASQAATTSPTAVRPTSFVSFFADPGTRVAVDGTPRGRCPQRDLALEPGSHQVRFSFEPTGESAGGPIEVPPGGRIQVLADFTGATPTMRVEPLPPRQR